MSKTKISKELYLIIRDYQWEGLNRTKDIFLALKQFRETMEQYEIVEEKIKVTEKEYHKILDKYEVID